MECRQWHRIRHGFHSLYRCDLNRPDRSPRIQKRCGERIVVVVVGTLRRLPFSLQPRVGIMALAAYHKETEIHQALVHASSALIEAIENDSSALDTATLAICTLALEAVDGDNVFAARR